MTHSFVMFQHRHRRFSHDSTDQAFSAARDHQIDIFIHFEHQFYRFPVGPGDQLHHPIRQARCPCTFIENGRDNRIGFKSFFAAAQNHRITGLYTNPGSIGSNIGTGFINNSDHSERNRYFSDFQTVGTDIFRNDPADRIMLCGHLPQAVSHSLYPDFIQFQPVDFGFIHAIISGIDNINTVGPHYFSFSVFKSIGHTLQTKLLGLRR